MPLVGQRCRTGLRVLDDGCHSERLAVIAEVCRLPDALPLRDDRFDRRSRVPGDLISESAGERAGAAIHQDGNIDSTGDGARRRLRREHVGSTYRHISRRPPANRNGRTGRKAGSSNRQFRSARCGSGTRADGLNGELNNGSRLGRCATTCGAHECQGGRYHGSECVAESYVLHKWQRWGRIFPKQLYRKPYSSNEIGAASCPGAMLECARMFTEMT